MTVHKPKKYLCLYSEYPNPPVVKLITMQGMTGEKTEQALYGR